VTSVEQTNIDLATVDPERLVLLLSNAGWEPSGGQPGLYARLRDRTENRGSETARASVIVPLDRRMADFSELLSQAITLLSAMTTTSVARVVADLSILPGDEIKFRKERHTVHGAVPWSVGEQLISSGREALLAAAKSIVQKRAYYGNTSGRFAHQFLDSVLMGQTEVGSYVVTAFTPVDQRFYEKPPKADEPQSLDVGVHRGREITQALVTSLVATQEAVAHYEANSRSLAGFEAGVASGVSRELANALNRLLVGAEAGEVRVEWATSRADTSELVAEPTTITFEGSARKPLEEAARHLSTLKATATVTATGWVGVVARPKRGQHGLIRLRVLAGSDAGTLQIPLSEEQFEVAASAIAHDQGLTITGREEQEGTRHYLYDARELHVTPLPRLRARRKREEVQPTDPQLPLNT
jgi:hypothetical protein